MIILNAKIKFEYLIHPGQTAECAYKLDKLVFQAYHSSLIYKYYCVSLFTRICQISLFYILLLYDVIFCVKSIKQTDKIEVARSIVLRQPSRPPSQGIFKTIDIERSMEGRCRTSLFLFSNRWLTWQGLVYLPLFEGAWTVMTFNLCCQLGCSRARDKSDENHVGILTCLTWDLVPKT